MKIRLNQIQMDYLNETILKHKTSLRQRLNINKDGRYYHMSINEDTADEIRDWINIQLQLKGFDVNYELTKEGEILDGLSNIFYINN